jgi:hypothetical protein
MSLPARANYPLAGLALAVVIGPVVVFTFASQTGRIRTAGDSARALGACFLMEVVAAVAAGCVVQYLKRPEGSSPDPSALRSRRTALRIARLAFWPSIVLTLMLGVAMVYAFMFSFAQLS